jgi:hypothetical protein
MPPVVQAQAEVRHRFVLGDFTYSTVRLEVVAIVFLQVVAIVFLQVVAIVRFEVVTSTCLWSIIGCVKVHCCHLFAYLSRLRQHGSCGVEHDTEVESVLPTVLHS